MPNKQKPNIDVLLDMEQTGASLQEYAEELGTTVEAIKKELLTEMAISRKVDYFVASYRIEKRRREQKQIGH